MDDYRYKSLQTLARARFDVVQNLTMRVLEKQIKVLDKAIEQQIGRAHV